MCFKSSVDLKKYDFRGRHPFERGDFCVHILTRPVRGYTITPVQRDTVYEREQVPFSKPFSASRWWCKTGKRRKSEWAREMPSEASKIGRSFHRYHERVHMMCIAEPGI